VTTTKTKSGAGTRLVGLLAVALVLGVAWTVFGTGVDTDRDRSGRVISAEVESSGNFHVTLNSTSSVHGNVEHADADYAKSFARDIPIAPNEELVVFLTSALDIDRERRQTHECRIKDNGKTVVSRPITVRAGSAGEVADCTYRTVG
jgi:hypothetical protein